MFNLVNKSNTLTNQRGNVIRLSRMHSVVKTGQVCNQETCKQSKNNGKFVEILQLKLPKAYLRKEQPIILIKKPEKNQKPKHPKDNACVLFCDFPPFNSDKNSINKAV